MFLLVGTSQSALVPPPPSNRRAVLQQSGAATLGAALAGLAAPTQPALATVNFDPERYGDKEVRQGTITRVKQNIRNELSADLTLVPAMLQLALTDAFSYNQATAAGGIDGSILLELDRESSAGLKPAAALVTRLAKELKRVTEVSYADLIAFAGAEALECTGGPRSLLQIGRQSSAAPSEEGARAGFSWEAPTLDGVRAVGKASGLSAREMVALVGAVEALKIASRPPPPVAAEEDADLLAEDTTLEEMGLVVSSYAQNKNAAKVTDPNYYAKNKLAVDVRAPKLGATPFDNSYFQQVAGKKRALTPFESALLADKETKGIVEEYAKSKQAFREDVRGAYAKVTGLGTNYVGASRLLDSSS